MRVVFTVQGTPVGKGRPRFTTANGYARSYTPQKTLNYENLVKTYYSLEVGQKKLQGAIKAKITAYFPIPKSTPKKLRAEMELTDVPHTKKPDGDNIIKAILDALNGIAYDDDSQVAIVEINKFYSTFPRAVVILEEMKGGE